jgi:hypothetical protein
MIYFHVIPLVVVVAVVTMRMVVVVVVAIVVSAPRGDAMMRRTAVAAWLSRGDHDLRLLLRK